MRAAGFEAEIEGKQVPVVPVEWMKGYSYLFAGEALFVPDLGEHTEMFARHVVSRLRDELRAGSAT